MTSRLMGVGRAFALPCPVPTAALGLGPAGESVRMVSNEARSVRPREVRHVSGSSSCQSRLRSCACAPCPAEPGQQQEQPSQLLFLVLELRPG